MNHKNADHYFLRGGGEMGELIRAKDWAKTSLGDPADWPQSLQTMVAVMLDNPFGMYIAWGSEYIQLYNDAYRPILGATKHPQALGISTKETFSEIWDNIIGSMFDGVMKGKAVGYPDLMLPLNRNGFVEECYFDFAYSPIRKDNGEVGGVLVTVIETTNKKNTEEALKESEARFRAIADDAPVFIFLAGENAEVEYLNKTWRDYTGISSDDYKGRAWAEITHIDDIEPATKIYMEGFKKRESCSFENRQKGIDGIYRTILWRATPRFSLNGEFIGMMGVGLDIHERKNSEEKLRESEQKVRALVENAPFPIAVYVGKEMIVELANQSITDIWGKGNDVIGKSFKQVLPELANQSVFEQIQKVFETGESFHTKNTPLDFIMDGKPYTYYFNYSFTPLYDTSGNIYGVMNTGVDLTELNIAKKKIEASDKRFRNTVQQAPVAITILKGKEFIVEMANDAYLQLVDKKEAEFVGNPLFKSLPEVEESIHSLLNDILNTGVPYHGNEVPVTLNRYGKQDIFYFDFLYYPLREDDGTISGVIAVATEVTEQVLTRKKIEENAEQIKRFKYMAENANDAFILMREDGTFAYLNERALESWGYTAEQARQLRVPDVDPIYNNEVFSAAFAKGQIEKIPPFETLHKRKDGTIYPVEINMGGLLLNSIPHMFAVARDITERKKSEEKIRESEQRLRLANEASGVAVWEWNVITGQIKWDSEMFKIYGVTPTVDNLVEYTTWSKAVVPEELAQQENILQNTVKNKGQSSRSFSITRASDGELRHIEAIETVRTNASGQAELVVGTNLDVTEKMVARKKIQESEKQKAFLLKLSDTLRQQTNPDDIEEAVTKIALDFVGVDLCYFNIIEGDNVIIRREAVRGKLTSVVGLYPISGYPLFKAILDNGHPLVVDNVKTSLKLDAALKQICVDLQNIASINVPVIKNGKPVAMLSLSQSEPRNWTDAEVQVAIAIAERTWTAIERTKAEEALLKSEEKYRTLFNSIDQGFLLGEVIRNKEGKGIDYFVHEVNATYEKQTGINIELVLGKTVLQAFPTIDNWWIETYASVVDSQYPVRFEKFFEFTNRWFEIKASPAGNEMFTILFTDITERILAVEKIKESENSLKLMIHQAPVAISIFRGMDYTMEIANKQALELLGRTEQELIGKPIFITMPELLSQGIKELLDGVQTTGKRFAMAERAVQLLRNGIMENVFINFSYEPLYDKDEKITGIMGVAIDVTEQVEVRKKVELNEEKLNIVIEASELGTYELNLKTKEPSYSKRYLEILGGYKEYIQLTHAQLLQHLHPGDLPIREKAFKEAFITGYLHYEARLIWSDKSVHWMEGKGKVFYDEENKPERIIGTIRDITEEKNHEQELKESEYKFRLLADSMPQHIWTSDPEGNLNYYNQSVFDYSGLTLEQIDKVGWIQIVHPDDREENIMQWVNSITTGKDFLFEHRFRRHDGEYRWQLSRAIPQRDETGKIQMWVGTSTDIQEHKTREEKKDEFISIASHEMKTPLTTAKAYLQMLELMLDENNGDASLYTKKASQSVNRLNELISELLDVSKIRLGKLNYTVTTFNFNDLIESAVENIQLTSPTHSIIKTGKVNDSVTGDKDRLEQVVMNLLTNAIKYSPGAEKVFINLAHEKDSITVSVKDAGIGIAQQSLAKIFEKYHRVEEHAVHFQGLGIGLFISYEIIKRHDGKLWAESEPGKGSTFYFTIPVKSNLQ